MIQQSKINGFIQSIADVAQRKKADVDSETKDILAGERDAIKSAAAKAADDYVRLKSAAIKLEAGKRISESAAECRKEVFERRNEIAQRTLAAVSEKLTAFTESAEYKDFIFKSSADILEAFSGENVTLLLREKDLILKDLLCERFPNVSVAKDDTISIGGVKGINSTVTLLIDDTLDARLKQQKKWFEENSGLHISMKQ